MSLQLTGTEVENRGRRRDVENMPGLPSPGGSPHGRDRFPCCQGASEEQARGGAQWRMPCWSSL
jgi:hypothetical protein